VITLGNKHKPSSKHLPSALTPEVAKRVLLQLFTLKFQAPAEINCLYAILSTFWQRKRASSQRSRTWCAPPLPICSA